MTTNLRAPTAQSDFTRSQHIMVALLASAVTLGYAGYAARHTTGVITMLGEQLLKAPRFVNGQQTTWGKSLNASTPLVAALKCGFDKSCSHWFNSAVKLQGNTDNLGMIFMGLAMLTAVLWRKVPSGMIVKDPGQGKWAGLNDPNIIEATLITPRSGREKKRELKLDKKNPRSLYLGHFIPWTPDGFLWKKPSLSMLRERDRHEHVMIVGASGSGKTRGVFRQNIVLDAVEGRTAIVYDLKWPQMGSGFGDLALYWKKRGRKVYVFAPFSPTSMRLPLLQDINTLNEALKLASAIIPRPEYKDETGAHYKDNERRALAAMILAIAQSPTPTMKELQRLGQMNAAEIEEWYQNQQNPEIKNALKAMFDKRKDQISDTLAGVMNKLQIFYNDEVSRATTAGSDPAESIDLKTMFREGGLLIIGIESKYLQDGEGAILLQLIKRRIDRALMDVADASPGGALPITATYYLDELPGLGRLPNLDKQLAQWRSKNVCMMLGVQNTEQGKMVYGVQEWASLSTGNAGTRLFFIRGTTQEDAEKLSKEIGEFTADVENTSKSGHALFQTPWSAEARKGTSTKLEKRPLLSIEEIKRYPRNLAVVFPKGQNPMMIATPPIHEPFIEISTPEGKQIKLVNQLHHYWAETMQDMTEEQIEREATLLVNSLSVKIDPNSKQETIKSAPDYWMDWLSVLLDEGALARLQRNDDKFKIMIRRESLPPQLTQERDLNYFLGCGWVTLSANEEELTITQAGLDTAGKVLKASLQGFLVRGPALYWARTHKDQVIGYPGGATETGNARYTPEMLSLPPAVALELYSVIPDLPTVTIDGQTFVQIPLSDPKALSEGISRATAARDGLIEPQAATGTPNQTQHQTPKPTQNPAAQGKRPAPPGPAAPPAQEDPLDFLSTHKFTAPTPAAAHSSAQLNMDDEDSPDPPLVSTPPHEAGPVKLGKVDLGHPKRQHDAQPQHELEVEDDNPDDEQI